MQSKSLLKYINISPNDGKINIAQFVIEKFAHTFGIGLDKDKQKASGIGFINIFNRVDAYNGKVEIVTFPESGCTLNITIPYII